MYHITLKSSNAKTGPIPVTTSSRKTCPDTCELKEKGCYAKGGPLAIHWSQVTKGVRGSTLKVLCDQIRGLPEGQLWRHNQAGDLPGLSDGGTRINPIDVKKLVDANKGRKGFTYTHKPVTNHKHAEHNREVIEFSNTEGFTINLSANNITQADEYKALEIGPVCVIVPEGTPKQSQTPAGNQVVVCPAQLNNSGKVNCSNCKLCQRSDRDFIIGFIAHGSQKARAEEVANGR